MTNLPFEGLAAVVTGGASGIGYATARMLIASGADVASLDLSPRAQSSALEIVCDVTNDLSVQSAVEAAATSFGRIDIVIKPNIEATN